MDTYRVLCEPGITVSSGCGSDSDEPDDLISVSLMKSMTEESDESDE